MERQLEYATVSLAKAYASQGHTQEALAMYRQLLANAPDDQGLKDAVADLENMAGPDDNSSRTRLTVPETDDLAQLVQSWIRLTFQYKKMMMLKKLKNLNQ